MPSILWATYCYRYTQHKMWPVTGNIGQTGLMAPGILPLQISPAQQWRLQTRPVFISLLDPTTHHHHTPAVRSPALYHPAQFGNCRSTLWIPMTNTKLGYLYLKASDPQISRCIPLAYIATGTYTAKTLTSFWSVSLPSTRAVPKALSMSTDLEIVASGFC